MQFVFNLISLRPLGTTSPAVLAAAKSVRMTGAMDTETIAAIRAVQETLKAKRPGEIVDGRVRPADGGVSPGKAVWTVRHLNRTIQTLFGDVWPRLDRIPGCPSEIQQMVRREVLGGS